MGIPGPKAYHYTDDELRAIRRSIAREVLDELACIFLKRDDAPRSSLADLLRKMADHLDKETIDEFGRGIEERPADYAPTNRASLEGARG